MSQSEVQKLSDKNIKNERFQAKRLLHVIKRMCSHIIQVAKQVRTVPVRGFGAEERF